MAAASHCPTVAAQLHHVVTPGRDLGRTRGKLKLWRVAVALVIAGPLQPLCHTGNDWGVTHIGLEPRQIALALAMAATCDSSAVVAQQHPVRSPRPLASPPQSSAPTREHARPQAQTCAKLCLSAGCERRLLT